MLGWQQGISDLTPPHFRGKFSAERPSFAMTPVSRAPEGKVRPCPWLQHKACPGLNITPNKSTPSLFFQNIPYIVQPKYD